MIEDAKIDMMKIRFKNDKLIQITINDIKKIQSTQIANATYEILDYIRLMLELQLQKGIEVIMTG